MPWSSRDKAALRLWNSWRRGRASHLILKAAWRHGWRKWDTLEAAWAKLGLPATLPQSVAAMRGERDTMAKAYGKALGVPPSTAVWAALETANVEAMRKALHGLPDVLGAQGELFEGEGDGQ